MSGKPSWAAVAAFVPVRTSACGDFRCSRLDLATRPNFIVAWRAEKRLAIKERKLEKAMASGDAAKIEAAKKEAATKARSLKIAIAKSKARPGANCR